MTAAFAHSVQNISAQEAWNILSEKTEAQLIDVRTMPEWSFVGTPNLDTLNKEVALLSWRLFPTMEVNQEFIGQLNKVAPNKNTPLIFMCKVGGRSFDAAAAATENGYGECYNVEHGFEGDKNNAEQRGFENGWKASQLAWSQS